MMFINWKVMIQISNSRIEVSIEKQKRKAFLKIYLVINLVGGKNERRNYNARYKD